MEHSHVENGLYSIINYCGNNLFEILITAGLRTLNYRQFHPPFSSKSKLSRIHKSNYHTEIHVADCNCMWAMFSKNIGCTETLTLGYRSNWSNDMVYGNCFVFPHIWCLLL